MILRFFAMIFVDHSCGQFLLLVFLRKVGRVRPVSLVARELRVEDIGQ